MLKVRLFALFLVAICCQSVFGQQPAPRAPKSRSRAVQYSLVSTLVPAVIGASLLDFDKKTNAAENVAGLAVGSVGLVCGPGAGHLYASNKSSFAKGAIVRACAGAAVAYSLTKVEVFGDDENEAAPLYFWLGGGVLVGSAVHDILTVGRSVDRYNQKQGLSNLRLQFRYFANHEAWGVAFSTNF